MNAIMVTEVVANEGRSCAFKGQDSTLAVARLDKQGLWTLRLSDGQMHHCSDFDEMRMQVKNSMPGYAAFFERRRIRARHHAKQRQCN